MKFSGCAAWLVCVALASPLSAGHKKKPNPDEGLVPEVVQPKRGKKDREKTQALPPEKEPPGAVAADSAHLVYHVSPLSAKGLLSQQTRDALRAILRVNNGLAVVKLRAFVAGQGDLRRIREVAADVFGGKRLPLPALTVIQVGELPLDGAQVVIESTAVESKPVNPNGVEFVPGQPGSSIGESIAKLKSVLGAARPLRLTCFAGSLENGQAALEAAFPGVAVNYMQRQREPSAPVAECDAVASLAAPPSQPVGYVGGAVLVNGPKLVFSSEQLGFGSSESDIHLALERLQKTLAPFNASLGTIAMAEIYAPSRPIAEKVHSALQNYYSPTQSPAKSLLPIEGLSSLDASFGIDIVAAAQ